MASPFLRKRAAAKSAAEPPGRRAGQTPAAPVRLDVIDYDADTIQERTALPLESALALCDGPRTTWLKVDGIHDAGLIERIGHHFNIHPLTIEDILHTWQRPKMEDYGHYLYIVLKMLRYPPDGGPLIVEQVSLILTSRVLVSFQENDGGIFAPVRERLNKGPGGRMRAARGDFLAYALIDAIVDHYFVILESLDAEIDEVEEDTVANPHPRVLERVHDLKRKMIALRKYIWPLREVIAGLSKQGSALIDPTTTLFLRDVHDHTIQLVDTIENDRDILSGLLDLYMTQVSNRLNEVMKVLTIIATIFIPVTFIAGVYGMNFKYMPELEWRWGYPAAWAVMIAVMAGLLVYFKRKDWF